MVYGVIVTFIIYVCKQSSLDNLNLNNSKTRYVKYFRAIEMFLSSVVFFFFCCLINFKVNIHNTRDICLFYIKQTSFNYILNSSINILLMNGNCVNKNFNFFVCESIIYIINLSNSILSRHYYYLYFIFIVIILSYFYVIKLVSCDTWFILKNYCIPFIVGHWSVIYICYR